jgi:hypothetical protein
MSTWWRGANGSPSCVHVQHCPWNPSFKGEAGPPTAHSGPGDRHGPRPRLGAAAVLRPCLYRALSRCCMSMLRC